MHTNVNDPIGVALLGNKLINKGMYFNTAQFTDIPVAATVFKPAVQALDIFNADSKKDKSQIPARDAKCVEVFGYIQQDLLYAKLVCNHDTVLIQLSGFDKSYEPTKAPVPPEPVITKVKKTAEAGVYKVYVKRNSHKVLVGTTPTATLKNVKYMIQLTTTADDPKSWITIEEGLSSTKLLFTQVVQGKRNNVRLIAYNSSGKSNPSAPYPFTPEM